MNRTRVLIFEVMQDSAYLAAVTRATEKALRESAPWSRMRHLVYVASFNAEMAAQGFAETAETATADRQQSGAA
jgi:hypothetical protein